MFKCIGLIFCGGKLNLEYNSIGYQLSLWGFLMKVKSCMFHFKGLQIYVIKYQNPGI